MLSWMQSQYSERNLYFKSADRAIETCGIDFAYLRRGEVYTDSIHAELCSLLPSAYNYSTARADSNEADCCCIEDLCRARIYGGLRFDSASQVAKEWEAFGGFCFALPLLELQNARCTRNKKCLSQTTLSVNIKRGDLHSLLLTKQALQNVIQSNDLLHNHETTSAATIDHIRSDAEPSTVDQSLNKSKDQQETSIWKSGVEQVLDGVSCERFRKVVLARRKVVRFPEDSRRNADSRALSIAKKLNQELGGNGYLFCLEIDRNNAFVGCTPERLFHYEPGRVSTQALAGTMRRDDALTARDSRELEDKFLSSEKDLEEHRHVVDHVASAIKSALPVTAIKEEGPHLRRLPHLVHLETLFQASFSMPTMNSSLSGKRCVQQSVDDVFKLLCELHPTPAVCGMPCEAARSEISKIESFDRGFYSGPFGCFSNASAEFCVAIRSGLIKHDRAYVYAGAGIVAGSEAELEWDEIELKMSTFCRVLQSFSIQDASAPTQPSASSLNTFAAAVKPNDVLKDTSHLNTLLGTVVIDELIRLGVGYFFVAPGSRSTPLVVGIMQSIRNVQYVSCHDERGAAFAALGYARKTGCVAAVITSSGTAVANLLPAVIEAKNDGIPLILITADRPPELRDVCSNQSIDQVKIFGSNARWFRDFACPDPISFRISALLSDIDYAFALATDASDPGAVHLNFMFRETLEPELHHQIYSNDSSDEDNEINGDENGSHSQSLNGTTQYLQQNGHRDVHVHTNGYKVNTCNGDSTTKRHQQVLVGAERWLQNLNEPWSVWSGGGESCSVESKPSAIDRCDFQCRDVLSKARRGLIIAGGLSSVQDRNAVCRLGEFLDWPVLTDILSGLRCFSCRHLIHFGDQIGLADDGMQCPDVIILCGLRVISKRIQKRILANAHSVIVVSERMIRADEHYNVRFRMLVSPSRFVQQLESARQFHPRSSELLNPLLQRSITLSHAFETIFNDSQGTKPTTFKIPKSCASYLESVRLDFDRNPISEPSVCRKVFQHCAAFKSALFVSNSMPIRDLDMYCGVQGEQQQYNSQETFENGFLLQANRGASGIDGVLSTGIGFALAMNCSTCILIGDLALLHDLNALHTLNTLGSQCQPVSIVVLNNGGGGIFSFLPIAKHTQLFTPLFDTPHSVGFEGCAMMFGLEYHCPTSLQQLDVALRRKSTSHALIEIKSDQRVNLQTHKILSSLSETLLQSSTYL
eukprot:CAMPEP_0182442740 /NCGR_PEP_ID=MMETSP1172-20130603/1634_1 /TAXON_ID=708627 /ORGANISM="Timspurckia oligopyrenoides, Strain CCMP3278" /LENGTH=1209 /DNA_ID=CAMNT_0024637757 /DNA_START=439 /DNA_END=4068 /DNA_ORIENTATION=-